MRIGITTDWTSDNNYGEILQCWALQQILKREGHEPFLIRFLRYDWKNDRTSIKPGRIQSLRRYIVILAKIILVKPAISSYLRNKEHQKIESKHPNAEEYYGCRNKEREFISFLEENIIASETIFCNYDELVANPPVADIYLTGSDQVWNYNMHISESKAFFLQFGDRNIKRIAYAPSIGHNTWPEGRKEELRHYLSSFNAISVRELSGVDICKSVGFDAAHVLDPTILLSAKDYIQSLCNTEAFDGEPYIYIYSMNYSVPSDIPWKEIRQYAKENGLKIKVTPGAGYTPCREIFDEVEYDYATISGWINNIANAKMIVTASFHGSVFSILFHKHLLYTPLKGAMSQSNNRVLGLLNDFDLNCMMYQKGRRVKDYADQAIDWNKTEKLIKSSRDSSISYLRAAIG